jgi:ABC-2 type transport system permease protein
VTHVGAISPYWQVARRSFRRFSTYRGATFAGVFTNTVFGFVKAYVLLAVYRTRAHVGSFDAIDVVTFTFVTQGMLATTGAFGELELGDRIQTGDVVSDLYRPLNFQAYWLAQDIGRAAFQAIFRGIPPFVIGALAFHLRLPTDPATWAEFGVSLVLAVVVGFSYRFVVSLAGFWLLDTRGSSQVAAFVMQFGAGLIIPLSFFPAALYRIAVWLPFAAVAQLPVEVFLGKHHGLGPAAAVLGRQLLWVVVLVALGELIVRRAFRRVVVQGG